MQNRYRVAALLVSFIGWSAGLAIAQTPQRGPNSRNRTQSDAVAGTTMPDAAEFPSYDAEVWRLQQEGIEAKATSIRFAKQPDSPEVGGLLAQNRIDEALAVLRRIVRFHPERMPLAFESMWSQSSRFSSRARGHQEALQDIVNAAKRQLPRLSRDDAARVAWQLLFIDRQPSCSPHSTEDQIKCFVADYAGTETALLGEVDSIALDSRPMADRLASLDRLAHDHPGTVLAAKALHQKAFQLSSGNVYNGTPPFEARRSDPTVRFLQVIDIVEELASGRYPPCKWVTEAPLLVAGFFASDPTYQPGNVERHMEAYFAFAVRHFSLAPLYPTRNGVGYILTQKIGDLLTPKGNSAAVEAILLRFEREAPNPAAARYLRAEFYVNSMNADQSMGRPAFYQKAVDTLRDLHVEASDPVNRKALATLASLYFSEGEYTRARQTLTQYLKAYPHSTWAWVAALRIGQCDEALSDWRAAVESYSAAATEYRSIPFARVLAHAYAGHTFEALDRFDLALGQYRAALAGWDADYGPTYTLHQTHRRQAIAPGSRPQRSTVDRQELTDTTARLQQSLIRPGGGLLERGRWLVEQGSFRGAVAPLERVIGRYGSSSTASDARYWSHRAALGIALQQAAGENASRAADEALTTLDAISRDRYDFAVCAAQIARASILWQRGAPADAEATMSSALVRWETEQRRARRGPPTSVAKDIAAIRKLVFLPRGGGVLRFFAGNEFARQRRTPMSFVIVNPDVSIRMHSGDRRRETVYQPLSGAGHVLFLNSEQQAVLAGILATLDRWENGRRVQVTGPARLADSTRPAEVLPFWNRFFSTSESWGVHSLQTGPVISEIEFLNRERTRAAVHLRAGAEGTTVRLQKSNGVWCALELVDSWIS